MAFWNNFKIDQKIKFETSYRRLVEKAKLDFDFAFLSLAGLATCVLGFSTNSSPIIIGAMIIAPLIYSVLVLPAALVQGDKTVFLENFVSLFVEIVLGIFFCVLLSFVLGIDIHGIEFIADLEQAKIVYFLVAAIAGSSAALSLFWPGVPEELTGVAVSVALVPPVAMIGIALANQTWGILLDSTLKLLLNLLGIIIGSLLILKFIKSRS